jgi:NADPH:quinone reductase-like Zn-dependent oxidoreductase
VERQRRRHAGAKVASVREQPRGRRHARPSAPPAGRRGIWACSVQAGARRDRACGPVRCSPCDAQMRGFEQMLPRLLDAGPHGFLSVGALLLFARALFAHHEPLKLDGKLVLVNGATSRLGSEVCAQLLRRGANVIVSVTCACPQEERTHAHVLRALGFYAGSRPRP